MISKTKIKILCSSIKKYKDMIERMQRRTRNSSSRNRGTVEATKTSGEKRQVHLRKKENFFVLPGLIKYRCNLNMSLEGAKMNW